MKPLKFHLLAGAALLVSATAAAAQEAPSEVGEVVVTGSRIRQTATDTTTPAPVSIIGADAVEKRGFTQVGEALKEMAAMSPPNIAANSTGSNSSLGSGQAAFGAAYPNLFNLGAGRTLTLINGRRVISTAGGLGDEAVDPTIVPIGLLQRIDVVQGGGAAVYGSGAIGGVVNYILRRNYTGLEIDVQASEDQRHDYAAGSMRLTAGTNFREGRGNVAVNLEYSKTGDLLTRDRPFTANAPSATATRLPGAGSNGIPLTTYEILNSPLLSRSGTVLVSPTVTGFPGLLRVNGAPVRFNADGTAVAPFDPGRPSVGTPTSAVGGDYDRWYQGVTLVESIPKVERFVANLISGYDLTDDIRLSGELTFAKVTGEAAGYRNFANQYSPGTNSIPGMQALAFNRNNAFLTPETIAVLSAASPTFASGGSLYLGKGPFLNLFEGMSSPIKQPTETYRGLVAIDGKFNAIDREFFWGASATYSEVHQGISGKGVYADRLVRAANAVKNASGQIVCGVNADADPNNNDAACVPINIFGTQDIGDAARDYLLVESGAQAGSTLLESENKEKNALLTFSGDLVKVPAGMAKFATTYEFREVSASFDPLTADHLGLVAPKTPINGASGKFHTHELAGELSVPIFGEDFSFPFAQRAEINGSFRYVDHSIAGKETVWGAGLRWEVYDGVVLRGAISRNFRAPNLRQLFLPASVSLGQAISVCTPAAISQGPAPATRRANCEALFAANPTFGVNETVPAGSTVAQRLAAFQPIAIGSANITTSGNLDLDNEISTTKSYGVVLQPTFAPGLTVTVDRINLRLKDALVQYGAAQFISTCFDSAPGTADEYCSALGYDAYGSIRSAPSRTVNAASTKLKAVAFTVNYRLPLSNIFDRDDLGTLTLGLQGTYNEFQSTTVAGATTRTDDTRVLPRWVGGMTATYVNGPWTVAYSNYFLDKVKINSNATPANSPDLRAYLASNLRHNISWQYEINDNFTVRAGINNFTDKAPSYPVDFFTAHGDILGRQFFVGLKARY